MGMIVGFGLLFIVFLVVAFIIFSMEEGDK